MAKPAVSGLIETALYVADLERSADFYRRVFGFELIHSEGDRLRGMSIAGKQILLLFRIGASLQPTQLHGGNIPAHDGRGTLHLAFSTSPGELDGWRTHLDALGVTIESEVHCGGDSIYFRDPDGHLVELLTQGCWPIY